MVALAEDLPRLWHAESTSSKDRKRILRLLIKDITVEKLRSESKAILHIRWQTDATEDLIVPLPRRICDKWQHSVDTIDRVRQLATTMTGKQIVNLFNQEGLVTNKGAPFTIKSIEGLRFKHKIPALCNHKSKEELSIKQVVEKFNVSPYLVRRWIECKFIDARRSGSRLWISINPEQEQALKSRIKGSSNQHSEPKA